MMLTVSMTVSHLYQNLETLKVSEALNRLLKVLIIAINPQSHSIDSYYEQGRGSLSAFSPMDTSDLHPQTRGGGEGASTKWNKFDGIVFLPVDEIYVIISTVSF